MKKARILVCVVLTLMLAIGMMACSSSSSKDAGTPPADTGGMADREESDADSDKEQSISGVVTDASMNTVTIKTDAGDELSFGTEDADVSKVNGMDVGKTLTIYYTGTIDGTDTSKVTVVAVQE